MAARATRRFRRSVILGIACLATLIWAAVEQFDVDPRLMLDLGLATLAGSLVVIVLAALFVALMVGLRRLFAARPEDQGDD